MNEKKTRQQHILLTEWEKTKLNEISNQLNLSQSVLIRACLNKSLREIQNALLSGKKIILDEELIIS